ncbi:MAG: hypothetical protein KJ703_05175 [Alphaproteobacteria bacterium]|nr:hypothetical protein [Alphaproteobacteria bacterium]
MDFEGPVFVVAIIALSIVGWLINNWIRAKHGYPLEDEWGGKTERSDTAEAQQLRAENAELRTLLGKVDKRMQVLERIVTDKGYSLADEIEALRDRGAALAPPTGRRHGLSDSGTPVDSRQTEQAR